MFGELKFNCRKGLAILNLTALEYLYFGYDDKWGEIDILVEIDIQLCFVYLLTRWFQMRLLWQNLTLGKKL